MKKAKKFIVSILCILIVGAIAYGIYYIIDNNTVNSPEKVTYDFVTALSSGNTKKAMKYSAMDFEDYVTDAYSESNLRYLIEHNSNGIGDEYNTPQEFYYAYEQSYEVSINNGKDMYNAMLSSASNKLDVKSIEILKTEELDLGSEDTKNAINFYTQYNFDGLNSNDYYNPKEITKAVAVEYKLTLNDGSENTYSLNTVYIDGNWRVLVNLLDY